jgi:hypothetical protein
MALSQDEIRLFEGTRFSLTAARQGRVEALFLSTDAPELRSGVDAGPADPLGIHSARRSNSTWWQQGP